VLIVAGAALGAVLTAVSMSGGSARATGSHGTTPPPVVRPVPSSFPPIPAGELGVVSLNPLGDPDTTFVIHGAGWRPGTVVSIELEGFGVSPIHPVVDLAGTFNYAINQDHEFVRGLMPARNYLVIVTGAHDQRATVKFVVQRGPPGGLTPPPSPP
jgi:hypothetical protein